MNQSSEIRPSRYHLVMCSFDGTDTASEVLHRLRAAQTLAGCEIEGEAVVSHDAAGKVHFHEKGAAGVGAAAGATAGGVLGLVGGPVVLPIMLVAGALVGGVAGHFMGQALPQEDLREVGESLPPGSSAYIALVDTAHADGVASAFAAEGARILNMAVETELSGAIREAVTHRIRRI
jgi:uncharacterized membrane protein